MVRSHYRRSSGRKVFMEWVSKFTLSRMDRAYNPPALKLQPHLARKLRQAANELGRC